MIIDIIGIELTPGNKGKDCLGNGSHIDDSGNTIECCCDECSYLMCCLGNHYELNCRSCTDERCPRVHLFE